MELARRLTGPRPRHVSRSALGWRGTFRDSPGAAPSNPPREAPEVSEELRDSMDRRPRMSRHRQQTQAKAARERTRAASVASASSRRNGPPPQSGKRAPARPLRSIQTTTRRNPREMKLAVGDLVVYGNHGIGRIAARGRQEVLGEPQEVVVLELEELRVTLPLERARTQLRPLANGAELRRVGEALRDDGELNSSNWLSRRRETLEKLIGATPVELAQIVSEGAQRERLRSANGDKRQLSPSEREIFTKARRLLSDEIALALDLQPTAAESWIDRHLERPA